MRRHGIADYRELVRRSVDEREWFWPAAIEDMGLEFFEPWQQVVDLSRGPEWATWFTGGKLNIAWNCVHRWAAGPLAGTEAAIGLGEDGSRRSLTFAELSHEVIKLAEALLRLGVEPGDRVAIYLPMSPEVAIASHACAHIGAVQVPVFSGFAAPGGGAASSGLGGEGRDHDDRLQPPRPRGADARDPRGGAARGAGARARRRRALGRADRGLPRPDRGARRRLGAPVPAHVHVRHDRQAEGRRARPRRLSRLDRTRGLLPGGCAARGRDPLRHRHGLDHGPVDRRRRRRDGLDDRLRRGRARLAARPALAADRAGAGLDPRLLADAHSRADPPRRPARPTCPACASS